ncbi:hypothetical protein BR93DRAFT_999352 [Coniochaeta sp. PMI_546]|nr:hypothetical protein BR93DRAFT_999352 [Coniochaeta sp. PMI_546]
MEGRQTLGDRPSVGRFILFPRKAVKSDSQSSPSGQASPLSVPSSAVSQALITSSPSNRPPSRSSEVPSGNNAVQRLAKRRRIADEAMEPKDNLAAPSETDIPAEAAWVSHQRNWLLNRYGGSSAVTVSFQTNDSKYIFPREVLVNCFSYFKRTLVMGMNQAVLSGGQGHCLNLPKISSESFALLLRHAQDPTPETFADCNDIDQLLQVLIAGSYLGYMDFYRILRLISGRLAVELLVDRRKLTSAHLDLVTLHNTSSISSTWGRNIWTTLAKAGVRPFVQEFFADLEETSAAVTGNGPRPGHRDLEQWRLIVRHCRQLRRENTKYAVEVRELVAKMLRNRRLAKSLVGTEAAQSSVDYVDPLSKVLHIQCYKSRLDDEVSMRFTI